MKYLYEETRIQTFRTQIRRSIEGYDGYNTTIKEIVSEARKLSANEIDIYKVNRDYFPMVMHLVTHGKSMLPELEAEDFLDDVALHQLLSIFSV